MRTYYYGKRERSKMHKIPIYETSLEVVVCGSMRQARRTVTRTARLGKAKGKMNYSGMVCRNHRSMALFLAYDSLDHNVIAHEVFHATHRIMEFCGVKMGKNHHEAAAHLNGYLSELVYGDLKHWKLKVR